MLSRSASSPGVGRGRTTQYLPTGCLCIGYLPHSIFGSKLCIHQPRLAGTSEWYRSIDASFFSFQSLGDCRHCKHGFYRSWSASSLFRPAEVFVPIHNGPKLLKALASTAASQPKTLLKAGDAHGYFTPTDRTYDRGMRYTCPRFLVRSRVSFSASLEHMWHKGQPVAIEQKPSGRLNGKVASHRIEAYQYLQGHGLMARSRVRDKTLPRLSTETCQKRLPNIKLPGSSTNSSTISSNVLVTVGNRVTRRNVFHVLKSLANTLLFPIPPAGFKRRNKTSNRH